MNYGELRSNWWDGLGPVRDTVRQHDFMSAIDGAMTFLASAFPYQLLPNLVVDLDLSGEYYTDVNQFPEVHINYYLDAGNYGGARNYLLPNDLLQHIALRWKTSDEKTYGSAEIISERLFFGWSSFETDRMATIVNNNESGTEQAKSPGILVINKEPYTITGTPDTLTHPFLTYKKYPTPYMLLDANNNVTTLGDTATPDIDSRWHHLLVDRAIIITMQKLAKYKEAQFLSAKFNADISAIVRRNPAISMFDGQKQEKKQ